MDVKDKEKLTKATLESIDNIPVPTFALCYIQSVQNLKIEQYKNFTIFTDRDIAYKHMLDVASSIVQNLNSISDYKFIYHKCKIQISKNEYKNGVIIVTENKEDITKVDRIKLMPVVDLFFTMISQCGQEEKMNDVKNLNEKEVKLINDEAQIFLQQNSLKNVSRPYQIVSSLDNSMPIDSKEHYVEKKDIDTTDDIEVEFIAEIKAVNAISNTVIIKPYKKSKITLIINDNDVHQLKLLISNGTYYNINAIVHDNVSAIKSRDYIRLYELSESECNQQNFLTS